MAALKKAGKLTAKNYKDCQCVRSNVINCHKIPCKKGETQRYEIGIEVTFITNRC
jgi:hypothetical protein